MGWTDEYDRKRHADAFREGVEKAKRVKAGKEPSEWIEEAGDQALGWLGADSEYASRRAGYKGEMDSTSDDESADDSDSEYAGGGYHGYQSSWSDSDSWESSTPSLPPGPLTPIQIQRRIVVSVMVLAILALLVYLGTHKVNSAAAPSLSVSNGKEYPVCSSARNIHLTDAKNTARFRLHGECWSGWITLPQRQLKFSVRTPHEIDFLFPDGRRVYMPSDRTPWPGAPPGYVFRLRGPGVATLRLTNNFECGISWTCSSPHGVALEVK